MEEDELKMCLSEKYEMPGQSQISNYLAYIENMCQDITTVTGSEEVIIELLLNSSILSICD